MYPKDSVPRNDNGNLAGYIHVDLRQDVTGPDYVDRAKQVLSKQVALPTGHNADPEELVTSVKVTALREEGGRQLADLDVRLTNAEGEEKVVGTATVALAAA